MDVPEIDCTQAVAMRAAGAAWIDVREPEERAEAYIEGTEFVPMAEAAEQLPARFPDQDTPLVISCRSGARSGYVVAHLRALGYTDVHNLRGGILAWAAEGRQILHGDG
jgi:rhodanese-related sulfurtransferase